MAVGLAFGFLRAAYGQYTVARGSLALRGDHLPMRLMRVLGEVHRRGVLRQNDAHTESAHQMCKGARLESLWTSVPR